MQIYMNGFMKIENFIEKSIFLLTITRRDSI